MILLVILFGLIGFMAFYLWSRGPAKRMPRRRIIIYALITGIIEIFMLLAIFNPIFYETPVRILFYLIFYNVGLLFLVLSYRSFIGLLFSLSLGIICMFLFVTAIGETISWLRRKREKHE